jgi:hypothetical protein
MTHEQQPPHDEATEREWTLQEQALRAERLGLDPSRDAKLRSYRAVAHALRQPMQEDLPSDFAAQVAARVLRTNTADTRLELWLSGAFLGVLVAMLAGIVVQYSDALLQLGRSTLLTLGLLNPWLLALAGCLLLPGILGVLMPDPGASRHRRLG